MHKNPQIHKFLFNQSINYFKNYLLNTFEISIIAKPFHRTFSHQHQHIPRIIDLCTFKFFLLQHRNVGLLQSILKPQTYKIEITTLMSVSSMTGGGKVKLKIVLLGDQHVGKSSIIQRFINDRFQENYNATIGIDFLVKNVGFENKMYRMQLWDTAGQQRFRALIPSYLKDSNCGLITYDLSNKKTLESAESWLDFYKQNKQPFSVIFLVGNKSDLPEMEDSCKDALIRGTAKKLGVMHFQISAKTGEGVQELFNSVIRQSNNAMKKQTFDLIAEKKQDEQQDGDQSKQIRTNPIKLQSRDKTSQNKEQKKKSCC